ncbi:serine/threonine protein kinase [Geodermatophilus saharensis]|uniref:non-specific serine/threonine protein kinase n=1 Tax=Geodermatophilus saharensis TaxID=1137994 RepID=A0A239I771_9ACTN|nr:protein kinase [Geodermatophilus saharensis]SNS89331.1 serine/threonine protein kinase [Geodermatophilus saharensis]
MTATGDLLGHRYRLGTMIAGGGMGEVWRAQDTLLERTVAVKLLRREFTGDPAFLQRFRAEARHAALLNDPHIAAVHDYGEVEGPTGTLPYLVMELVHGTPLSELLVQRGRLDVASTLRIVRQTAAALAAAHAAGVVHRDVKPANVLVTGDGDVKITDFGIAWSASSLHLTRTGQVLGTAHYLSPEQADGVPASPASDVYALGVVAYQCLAGRVPFDGDGPVQIALAKIRQPAPPLPPDVPGDVRDLVARAMARDPAARFPDGAALRDAVDALTPAAPATAAAPDVGVDRHATAVLPFPLPATGPAAAPLDTSTGDTAGDTAVHDGTAPEEPPRRRRAWPAVAGAAVAAVLVALGVWGLLGSAGDDPSSPPAGATAATTTSSAPAPPSTVRIDPAALVGRPVAEVEAELAALGLQVQRRPLTTADVADGLVIAVDPAGELLPGQPVTLTHAVAPPPAPAPTATPAPAPAPAPEEQDSGDDGDEGSGNGNGNGRGNGNGKDKDKEKD